MSKVDLRLLCGMPCSKLEVSTAQHGTFSGAGYLHQSRADDLFPEYPIPKRSTSQRERSFRASNPFTEYRRSVGVEEVVPGRRRSLVNFHSFRRYFITKAEQADQMEHIIAVVVGHMRTGMTLGRYSGGPLLEQARRCVEAVRLP